MVEKINWNPKHMNGTYPSGYFKPQGKEAKRTIHKKARRMDFCTNRKGIYNRIGTPWEWS